MNTFKQALTHIIDEANSLVEAHTLWVKTVDRILEWNDSRVVFRNEYAGVIENETICFNLKAVYGPAYLVELLTECIDAPLTPDRKKSVLSKGVKHLAAVKKMHVDAKAFLLNVRRYGFDA